MLCPVDSSQMLQVVLGSEVLHRCNECSGTFVAGNHFREIRAFSAIEIHRRTRGNNSGIQTDARAELKCPKDGECMCTLSFKGVDIDVCGICHSVWFDRGELEKIVTNVSVRKHNSFASLGNERPWIESRDGFVGDLDGIDLIGEIIEFIGAVCS